MRRQRERCRGDERTPRPLGTTLACQVLVGDLKSDVEPVGLTLCTADGNGWLRAMPAMVGIACIDWALRLVGADHSSLGSMLASGPLGANGVSALPYLSPSGERAPFSDSAARGVLSGLTLETTAAEYRSRHVRGARSRGAPVLRRRRPVGQRRGLWRRERFARAAAAVRGRPGTAAHCCRRGCRSARRGRGGRCSDRRHRSPRTATRDSPSTQAVRLRTRSRRVSGKAWRGSRVSVAERISGQRLSGALPVHRDQHRVEE
jgi:hypothetical protein